MLDQQNEGWGIFIDQFLKPSSQKKKNMHKDKYFLIFNANKINVFVFIFKREFL